MKRKLLTLLLSFALLLPLVPVLPADALDIPADKAWATNAITWIHGTGLLTDDDFTDFGKQVTRASFARFAVILYQLITGEPAPDPSDIKNPFTDTDDIDILRAYKLKIINGTEVPGIFWPEGLVNREQIAVMLLRALDASKVNYSRADVSGIHFPDEDQFGWAAAAEACKRAYLIQILNGTQFGTMNPKGVVTVAEVYQILYNVFMNRESIKAGQTRTIAAGSLGTLSLKYTGGGKYETGWCEESYHSRPVITDLDGDGTLEIIAASYTILCLDAATGAMKWRIPVGYDRSAPAGTQYKGRTWPDVYVGDIDGDGRKEIVTGHQDGTHFTTDSKYDGFVAVYDDQGYFKPGWPVRIPTVEVSDWEPGVTSTGEVYSVAVADLDSDGTAEIAVGVGVQSGMSVWVYEHNGALRTGWPQLSHAVDGKWTHKLDAVDAVEKVSTAPDIGYAWGIFNDNLAIGDVDGDGQPEIVAPSDMGQISVYRANGTQVKTSKDFAGGVIWGRVGTFSDAEYEKRVYNGGFGRERDRMGEWLTLSKLDMKERLTAHFTHSKAVIADLDGNGTNEVVVVGDIHDRNDEGKAILPHLYQELYIFNGDRTRYNAAWSVAPTVKQGPLVAMTNNEFDTTMERNMPDPVCADLDGDGKLEILYPDYTGKLNCYWLDHTQHGSWPINVYDGSAFEYATAPAIHDFNGDGKPEVVFATYTQKNGTKKGSLYIADANGKLLQQVQLPDTADTSNSKPNGSMSAPVIYDVDGDGKAEIVLQTYLSGVTVYDLD